MNWKKFWTTRHSDQISRSARRSCATKKDTNQTSPVDKLMNIHWTTSIYVRFVQTSNDNNNRTAQFLLMIHGFNICLGIFVTLIDQIYRFPPTENLSLVPPTSFIVFTQIHDFLGSFRNPSHNTVLAFTCHWMWRLVSKEVGSVHPL